MDKVREMRLKKVLQDALNYFDEPTPSAYDRFLNITEKLFENPKAKVVLVMNRKDFKAISGCTSFDNPYNTMEIKKNMYSAHGEVEYTILDDAVDAMYGYLLAEKQ